MICVNKKRILWPIVVMQFVLLTWLYSVEEATLQTRQF